jgi:copper resistance protein B
MRSFAELNLYGEGNVEHGIGAGFSSTDIGLRMRYEIRREMAPYIGVTWNRMFGETRDLAEASGNSASCVRFVVGLRLWY